MGKLTTRSLDNGFDAFPTKRLHGPVGIVASGDFSPPGDQIAGSALHPWGKQDQLQANPAGLGLESKEDQSRHHVRILHLEPPGKFLELSRDPQHTSSCRALSCEFGEGVFLLNPSAFLAMPRLPRNFLWLVSRTFPGMFKGFIRLLQSEKFQGMP